jgi:hypothetical protein
VDGDRHAGLVALLGLGDLAVAAFLTTFSPDRWTERRLVVVAVGSLVMVDLFALSGAVPTFGYPTFFLVLFAWIGLALPRGHGLRLAVPAAVAYVLPPILRDGPVEVVVSVIVAVPVMVLIAEVCAAVVARLDGLASALALTGPRRAHRRRRSAARRRAAARAGSRRRRDHDRRRPLQAGQRPSRPCCGRPRPHGAGRAPAACHPQRRPHCGGCPTCRR